MLSVVALSSALSWAQKPKKPSPSHNLSHSKRHHSTSISITYHKTSTRGAAAPASDEGNQNEAGFRIVFRDSNGVQTAIEEAPIIEVDNEAELDAMSQIYSLDGRSGY